MYGTTQRTPEVNQMPFFTVVGTGSNGNGLSQDKTTWFVGTRMCFAYRGDLTLRRGTLREIDYSRIQRMIKNTLGIDAAPPTEAVLAASWRGRVVALRGPALYVVDAAYGLVITNHALSAREYDQIIVPLRAIGDDDEPRAEDVLTDDANLAALVDSTRAVLSTDRISYVFQDDEIDDSKAIWAVSDSVMEQVEARLRARFALQLVR